MRDDIRELQDMLTATEFACVPPGLQSTSGDFYPAVQSTYPELCDDDLRCDDVCTNGADQPEWKHAVRRVQQQLVHRENIRLSPYDTRGKRRVDDTGRSIHLAFTMTRVSGHARGLYRLGFDGHTRPGGRVST